jgi:hypothetical protein
MTELRTVKKSLGFAALCAGLIALPLAAQAGNASTEIKTAAQHAHFSANSKTIEMVHTHMHHALNCLVGPGGDGFDKTALNPCKNSGNGAIPDTTDAATKKKLENIAKALRLGLADDDLNSAQNMATSVEVMLKHIDMK